MQKKTKRIITLTILILIILIISILILNKSKQMPETINQQAQAQYTTTIGEQVFDITNAVTQNPNPPTISAGMIPVKWDGTYWTITSADDENWYNYENGKPAYIMLNDGTYQSELVRDMTNKKLAAEGTQILNDELGTIYMWLPRFAYNEQGEILHIKQACSVAGSWTMPEIFTYETEKIDLSLAGVWIEYNPLSSTNEVTTKINNMTGEGNAYGFIANTKSIAMTQNDLTAIEKYSVGAGLASALNDPTNSTRTILKITNTNEPEPIKGKAYYDEEEEKIKIEVTYRTHAISKILDENGKILSQNSWTADTGEDIIGNKTYYYIVIDNKNNVKRIKVKVTGLDIYIIETEEDLKYFRDAVNSGKTTVNTKAYQIADVEINKNKYTINEETREITFAEDAEQWTPIGYSYEYKGKYYGGNYSISGIYIATNLDYHGLFGHINGGYIQDLNLKKSSIVGKNYVGGIVAYATNNNSIINCSNEGNIQSYGSYVGGIVGCFDTNGSNNIIKECYNTGMINSWGTSIGGIIGFAGHLTVNIEDCYNKGTINSSRGGVGGIAGTLYYAKISNCYNEAEINGKGSAGGIVGTASGYSNGSYSCNISKSYNIGNITSTGNYTGGIVGNLSYYTIDSCYNRAIINGDSSSGGITGSNSKGTIVNCYNVGDVNAPGVYYVGGISATNELGTINNSYNKGSVVGGLDVGGIAGGNGYVSSDTEYSYINNCVNATENITATKWIGAICGYKKSGYAQINSAKYLKNTSSLNGIGLLESSAGGTVNTGCTSYADMDSMPTILEVINSDNAFVEDTEGINGGYPILDWQVEVTE